MVKMVLFSCGCIGLPPQDDGTSLCFYHCDADDDGIGLGERNQADKKHAPVSAELAAELLRTVQQRSYAYQELATALRLFTHIGSAPVEQETQRAISAEHAKIRAEQGWRY
jgi:hypothetical protein